MFVPRENENLMQHNMRCFVDALRQPYNDPNNFDAISGIFIPVHRFDQTRQILTGEGLTRSPRELEALMSSSRMKLITRANAEWETAQIYDELRPNMLALGIRPSSAIDSASNKRREIQARYSSFEEQQLAWRALVNNNYGFAVPSVELSGYYLVTPP